jgi:phosphoribosyl 1,2-cyclic phosphodiesterase
MPLFVKFWGVRGSIPTPGPATRRYGGNTSCVEVRSPESHFICDAGSGIRELGVWLARSAAGQPIESHLMLSHAHWDHIQGFPFFGPAYNPTTTLRVYGTEPGDGRFHALLSGQMRSDYFPVRFADLPGNIVSDHLDGGQRVVGDTEVSVLPVCHPGGSLSYKFRLGSRSVVYSTDNELDLLIANPEDASRPEVLRQLPADLIEFVRGADLLIADGQYTDAEYPNHVNWGHSRASTCVDLAVAAGVKQLAIFHHDPMQSDSDVDAKIETCRDRAARLGAERLSVFGAREGVELRIG